MERRCTRCLKIKIEEQDFYTKTVSGKRYFASLCKKCEIKRVKKYHKTSSGKESRRKWELKYIRERRKTNRAYTILSDSRKTDRRSGRKNNLNQDFIRNLIKDGCSYCGVQAGEMKITVDRIDNRKGHLKRNVVSACLPCNLTRGNMPYKAWLVIVPAMRKARKLGLLSKWNRRR